MRQAANETGQAPYSDMMRRVATSLECEAARLTEIQVADFSRHLNALSATLFLHETRH